MIRRATPADQPAISLVLATARDEMTYVPRIPDGVRPTLGRRIMEWVEVWLAESEGVTRAFSDFEKIWSPTSTSSRRGRTAGSARH
jgi:hypothetical protein